jgi:hypothetical protein
LQRQRESVERDRERLAARRYQPAPRQIKTQPSEIAGRPARVPVGLELMQPHAGLSVHQHSAEPIADEQINRIDRVRVELSRCPLRADDIRRRDRHAMTIAVGAELNRPGPVEGPSRIAYDGVDTRAAADVRAEPFVFGAFVERADSEEAARAEREAQRDDDHKPLAEVGRGVHLHIVSY